MWSSVERNTDLIFPVVNFQMTTTLIPEMIIPTLRSNWTDKLSKCSVLVEKPPDVIALIERINEVKKSSSVKSNMRLSRTIDTRYIPVMFFIAVFLSVKAS